MQNVHPDPAITSGMECKNSVFAGRDEILKQVQNDRGKVRVKKPGWFIPNRYQNDEKEYNFF
jgi:hypothetical protein